MLYSKLVKYVQAHAHTQKENAAYSGSHNDGGSGRTLSQLDEFKQTLVVQHDLRPSEYYKLNSMDVGEPAQFKHVFDAVRREMAKDIKL